MSDPQGLVFDPVAAAIARVLRVGGAVVVCFNDWRGLLERM